MKPPINRKDNIDMKAKVLELNTNRVIGGTYDIF